MMRVRTLIPVMLATLIALPALAAAQERADAGTRVVAPAIDSAATHHTLRAAKWATLAATVATAAYGFHANRSADRQYADLERQCEANTVVCNRRIGSAYADADMERQYQEVRRLDHRARAALIVSQVGIAAAAALFIIDLRDAGPAEDIPYVPDALQRLPNGSSLQLLPGRDDGVQLRVSLPLPLRK